LLIKCAARVQTFNVLQQRLNRKSVTLKLMAEFPAHLRAYDLLAEGVEDLRNRPFSERRERLQGLVTGLNDPRIDISPLVPFKTWSDLTAARAWQALVLLFRLHVRRLEQRGERRRTRSRRQGLFRIYRRGVDPDRSFRPSQYRRSIRPRARGRTRAEVGAGARGCVRGVAALDAPQVRYRDALSSHQSFALGQAAGRSRSAGDTRKHADAARACYNGCEWRRKCLKIRSRVG